MTVLSTDCRRCGEAYDLHRADLLGGYAWWSLCPRCRALDAAELPRASPAVPRHTGPRAGLECGEPVGIVSYR